MEPGQDHEDGARHQEANVMGRILTLRGQIGQGEYQSILDYEGIDLTRGWKVISGNTLTIGTASDVNGGAVLHTDDVRKTFINFEDNQQIGWIGGPPGSVDNVIDPNHVIVNTLFISGLARVTYLVILEEVVIEPIQNIIYQLKERAQAPIE